MSTYFWMMAQIQHAKKLSSAKPGAPQAEYAYGNEARPIVLQSYSGNSSPGTPLNVKVQHG